MDEKEVAVVEVAAEAEAMSEATVHHEFDPILFDWRRLAAVAWEGYLVGGLGAVTVDVGESIVISYRVGPPCPCHAAYVDLYDPEQQAVLVVRTPHGEDGIYLLGGWPPPPEAHSLATARDFDAVVH